MSTRALKPIRIQAYGPVIGISHDKFEAWLARFDE
jgi:hypothetical protein